jgi:hypothetical protein
MSNQKYQGRKQLRTRPVQDAPTAWESGLTSKQKNVAARENATNRAAMTMEMRVIPNSGTPHGLQALGSPASWYPTAITVIKAKF